MYCRLLLPGRLDKRYELYMSAWHLLNRRRRKLYEVSRWQIRLKTRTADRSRCVLWYMSFRLLLHGGQHSTYDLFCWLLLPHWYCFYTLPYRFLQSRGGLIDSVCLHHAPVLVRVRHRADYFIATLGR